MNGERRVKWEVGLLPRTQVGKWRKTELTRLRGQTQIARDAHGDAFDKAAKRHTSQLLPWITPDDNDQQTRQFGGEHHLQISSPAPRPHTTTTATILSGTLGLGVDAAEISSWRNPPFGG